MAGQTEKKVKQPAAPAFTLRADRPGHIHALIAAAEHLEGPELADALERIREFELHQEK